MRTIGAVGGAAERPARIAEALADVGGRWLGERRCGEDVVAEIVLPPARRARWKAPKPKVELRVRRAQVPALPGLPELPAPAKKPTAVREPEPTYREGAVLALLDDRKRMTTREVIDALGWSRSTTRDVLAPMVTKSRIMLVAASARSPFHAYNTARRCTQS